MSTVNPKIFLALAIVYSSLLAYLSLISIATLPGLDQGYEDKVLHFLAYAVFAIVWFLVFRGYSGKALWWAFLWAFLFGAGMELLQGLLSEVRQADILDVLANTAGALVGVGMLWLLRRRVKK